MASKGGAPRNPEWYHNLVAHPDEVTIQDGPEPVAVTVREVQGDEKAQWWERAVAVYPPYSEYQERTDRPDSRLHRQPGLNPTGSQPRGSEGRDHGGAGPGIEQGLALGAGLCPGAPR